MGDYEDAVAHLSFVRGATNDKNQIALAQSAVDAASKKRKPVNSLATATKPQQNWLGQLNTALTPKKN